MPLSPTLRNNRIKPSSVKRICVAISIVRSATVPAMAGASFIPRCCNRRATTISPPICARGSRLFTASRIQRSSVDASSPGRGTVGPAMARQPSAEHRICNR
jgi:hypothetical protein